MLSSICVEQHLPLQPVAERGGVAHLIHVEPLRADAGAAAERSGQREDSDGGSDYV
jgi:hypothetical protein